MSAIGAYTVYSVRGTPPLAGNLTEEHVRPGVPGYDVHDTGWGGNPKTLQVIALYSSVVNRNAARLNFNALKGSVISVTDDQDTSWTNLLVKNVEFGEVRNAVLSCPSGDEYRLDFSIELLPLALGY